MTRFVSCLILLAAVGSCRHRAADAFHRPARRHAAGDGPESRESSSPALPVEKSSSDLAAIRAERSAQLYAGSGLGATYGIPQSIQGAVPSIANLTMRQPLVEHRAVAPRRRRARNGAIRRARRGGCRRGVRISRGGPVSGLRIGDPGCRAPRSRTRAPPEDRALGGGPRAGRDRNTLGVEPGTPGNGPGT